MKSINRHLESARRHLWDIRELVPMACEEHLTQARAHLAEIAEYLSAFPDPLKSLHASRITHHASPLSTPTNGVNPAETGTKDNARPSHTDSAAHSIEDVRRVSSYRLS